MSSNTTLWLFHHTDFEQRVHAALADKRVDLADKGVGTEWFRCSLQEAIKTVRDSIGDARTIEPERVPSKIASPTSSSSEEDASTFYSCDISADVATKPWAMDVEQAHPSIDAQSLWSQLRVLRLPV